MKCVLFFFLAIISLGYGCHNFEGLLHPSSDLHNLWSIHSITRMCQEDCCLYQFFIWKGHGVLEACAFSVAETDDMPSKRTGFTNVACIDFPKYSISGKYEGSLLNLTIANHESDRKATFEIEEESIVYPNIQPLQMGWEEPLPEFERRWAKSIADAPSWTLRNVLRSIRSDNRIWMGFHITSEGYASEWCYMLVHVNGDPQTASFTEEPCVGSNFTVSWGYMAENDGGIMTLLNPQGTRSSWFGWNHVNSVEHLEDVGPNATSDAS